MRMTTIKHLKRLLVLAAVIATIPSVSSAQVGVSITIAPPVLPVYVQPAVPEVGYMWTPGYWAWAPDGAEYYWVPGAWVEPPSYGLLWTPGYWGWEGGFYNWHPGYWGNHVGFYGGIAYGFGYGGVGFDGGYWKGREFYYNRHMANVNVNIIRNVYDGPVIRRNKTRVSYNGSHGGIAMRPTPQQLTFAHKTHRPETAMQKAHARRAGMQKELRTSVNHRRPPVAASPKAGVFGRSNSAPAKGNSRKNDVRPQAAPSTPAHRNIVNPMPDKGRGNHNRQQPDNKPNSSPNMHQQNNTRPAPQKIHLKPNAPRPVDRPKAPQGGKAAPNSRPSPKRPR